MKITCVHSRWMYEDWCTHTYMYLYVYEYYSALFYKEILSFFNSIDEPGRHCAKWNKVCRERETHPILIFRT